MKGAYRTGRTELKYLISDTSARLIHSRLSPVLSFDPYAKKDGSYQIRSLYFDDALYRAYYDKEAGIQERRKFRIRYYNGDPGFIRLEEKEKNGNVSFKTGVRISRESAEKFASGRCPAGPFDHPLYEDFSRRVRTGAIQPVLFTDYYRTSFCHPAGDLRITLDRCVSASRFTGDLWNKSPSIPAISPGDVILEIKYSGVFPAYITELLEGIPRVPSAFSKYCMCCEALF